MLWVYKKILHCPISKHFAMYLFFLSSSIMASTRLNINYSCALPESWWLKSMWNIFRISWICAWIRHKLLWSCWWRLCLYWSRKSSMWGHTCISDTIIVAQLPPWALCQTRCPPTDHAPLTSNSSLSWSSLLCPTDLFHLGTPFVFPLLPAYHPSTAFVFSYSYIERRTEVFSSVLGLIK